MQAPSQDLHIQFEALPLFCSNPQSLVNNRVDISCSQLLSTSENYLIQSSSLQPNGQTTIEIPSAGFQSSSKTVHSVPVQSNQISTVSNLLSNIESKESYQSLSNNQMDFSRPHEYQLEGSSTILPSPKLQSIMQTAATSVQFSQNQSLPDKQVDLSRTYDNLLAGSNTSLPPRSSQSITPAAATSVFISQGVVLVQAINSNLPDQKESHVPFGMNECVYLNG